MYTKLTLNVEQAVIENAKIYAKNNKKSISKLVEGFLASISTNKSSVNEIRLGPITKELAGIIEVDTDINYKDILTDALMEKYV
jgi:hypothetical protein